MSISTFFKDIKAGRMPTLSYMIRRIWEYAGQYSKEYQLNRLYLFTDYCLCALRYGCSGNDYFVYRFFLLKHPLKKTIVCQRYEMNFEKAHTNSEQLRFIADKEAGLVHFRDFMQRDWCGTSTKNTLDDYQAFYAKHERGIVKPLDQYGGNGIEILPIRERFSSAEALRTYCLSQKLLIEAIIPQHEELRRIYPDAINTIRMLTLQGKCIGAALRMGVGGANVDNAHAGGIFTEIDLAEGVLLSPAIRYTGEQFICHPTTGTVIPGACIPFWQDCKAMAEAASRLVPDIALIGWDIAVTPNGPTLVEANDSPGMELIQAPLWHGLMHEFEKANV